MSRIKQHANSIAMNFERARTLAKSPDVGSPKNGATTPNLAKIASLTSDCTLKRDASVIFEKMAELSKEIDFLFKTKSDKREGLAPFAKSRRASATNAVSNDKAVF